MFYHAYAFNQDISKWDTKNISAMYSMFDNARAFNQPIGAWDVSNVDYMLAMFNGATSFNQDLSKWCVSKIKSNPRTLLRILPYPHQIILFGNLSIINMYCPNLFMDHKHKLTKLQQYLM